MSQSRGLLVVPISSNRSPGFQAFKILGRSFFRRLGSEVSVLGTCHRDQIMLFLQKGSKAIFLFPKKDFEVNQKNVIKELTFLVNFQLISTFFFQKLNIQSFLEVLKLCEISSKISDLPFSTNKSKINSPILIKLVITKSENIEIRIFIETNAWSFTFTFLNFLRCYKYGKK